MNCYLPQSHREHRESPCLINLCALCGPVVKKELSVENSLNTVQTSLFISPIFRKMAHNINDNFSRQHSGQQ